MATITEKSFCVLHFVRGFSVISVQHAFRNRYGKEALTNKSISAKVSSKQENRLIVLNEKQRRKSVSDEAVKRLSQSFVQMPQKSTRVAACELGMTPENSIKTLRKKLNFKPYHLQWTKKKNSGVLENIRAPLPSQVWGLTKSYKGL
ncbi:hypothetical protein TNCV_3816391 [Trichonephila clavipes]|nr:hypothetical protein TNCV_3816391 [Trichonephila clavipes]